MAVMARPARLRRVETSPFVTTEVAMPHGLTAQRVLRAVWNGLARLNGLLVETGSSDEDLVFHMRNSQADRPPTGGEFHDLALSRADEASERPRGGAAELKNGFSGRGCPSRGARWRSGSCDWITSLTIL